MHCGGQRHARLWIGWWLGQAYSQSATLRAPDLHNATILTFITWDVKWFIWLQNKTCIEADTAYINLTPSRYDVLSSVIVSANNDITTPLSFMTSQINSITTQKIIAVNAWERVRKVLKSHDDAIKWRLFPRYWPLCGDLSGHRWTLLTMASDAEPWYFYLICA